MASPKQEMPGYTRSGYVARGKEVRKNLQDKNQIKSSGNDEVKPSSTERYLAPGAGHRAESVEGNKRAEKGNKIKGMPPVQQVTGGCVEKVPAGKMRNEGGDRDPNK